MSTTTIGSLQIEMLANLARLQGDMDKAKGMVGDAMGAIQRSAEIATKALGALGVAASAAGLVVMIEKTIEAAAEMYNLSLRTGVAVESLSAMRGAAKLSGTDMNDVATGLQKLSKNLVEAESGTGKAAKTFQALGVSIYDGNGKLKTADVAMLDIAKALQGFEAGAGTTTAQMNLMGKSGANLAAFMQELAEKGTLAGKMTTEQAKQAHELEKAQIQLQMAVQGVVKAIALDLLPVIVKLGSLIKPAAEVLGLWFAGFVVLPAVITLATTAFNAYALSVYEGTTAMSVFATSMTATITLTKAAVIQFGLLNTAMMLAIAAFAGWKIGSWLRDNFVEAQLAGIAFVDGLMKGWEAIKYGAQVAWAYIASAWDVAISGMGGALGGFLKLLAGGLSTLGMDKASEMVLNWATKTTDATKSTTDLGTRLAGLRKDYDGATAAISAITDDMADEAIAHFQTAEAATKHKKALDDLGKAGKDDGHLKAIMEQQVKAQDQIIQAEMKLLGDREKAIDYYYGLEYMTLRDAETKKQELLGDSALKVKAAYDKELQAVQAYIAAGQALQGSKDSALSKKGDGVVIDGQTKLTEIRAKQAAAEVESNNKILDSSMKIMAVGEKFNLVVAERARQAKIADDSAQFQIDMLGKSTLEVLQGNNARKIQLDLQERIYQLQKQDPSVDTSGAKAQAATETERTNARIAQAYNAQRDAIFGANEALRKYQEDASNIGANVEHAMTNAFKGMEDALVSFVQTGKLNFKSLADGIIGDLIRIQIQQSITGPLAAAMKDGGGIAGVLKLFGLGGTDSSQLPTGDFARMDRASLPSFAVGTDYVPHDMIAQIHQGERIVPASQNNGSMGGTITHNVVINVDASANTAEVYSNVSRALQENNQRLTDALRQQGVVA